MTGVTHGLVHDRCAAGSARGQRRCAGRGLAVELLDDFDAWPGPSPTTTWRGRAGRADDEPLHGHAVHTIEHLRALVWVRGAGSAAGRSPAQSSPPAPRPAAR